MSSQTGARGASRSRGRLQPRTDPELRSDSERLANDQKRVAAKAAKSNFTIRGGAAPRGSSVTKTGDAAARSQAGQRARGSEQKQYSGTSRGRGARVDGSSSRGVARIQAANDNENADLKPKGDGIKGHFVEYLSGGSSSRGGSSTRGSARGGFTSKPGSRTQNDRTPSTKSSTKSSSTAGSRGQAWRDPRQEGNGNYMQSMADLFQTLKKKREQERKIAIRDGTMSDPDKPTTLANAITPVGTCQDMCPEFERVERIVQNMVDGCEKVENNAETAKVPFEKHMIKRFRRSAAGYDEQLPSDIRPPLVLKKTLDYLIEEVVGGPELLHTVHKYVWDRTRGIRNDFSIQQVTKKEDILIAVDCFERIARFHILSLHLLSRPGNDEFDHHQEREQLNNTLLSLMYYYDDHKKRIKFPNEAEFRSYCIILEIQDQRPDLEDRVQSWGTDLLKDPRIENALKIYAAACNSADEQGPLRPRAPFSLGQGNYMRFFQAVESKKTSYLLACVCEIYFNHVRSNALEVLVAAYRRVSKNGAKVSEDLVLDDIEEFLGFDNEEQTMTFCEEHGFTIGEREDGRYFLDVSSVSPGLSDSNPRRKQIFSEEIVEYKARDMYITAVINGLTLRQARERGLIEETSGEVSMGRDEYDEYSPEESSSDEEDEQHGKQSASPTKTTFQKPTTPTMSAFGNPFNQSSTTSASRNPFDTAVQPTLLKSGKGQETADEKSVNPFLLSSKITPQDKNPFGLSPSTATSWKPFETSSVDPATSNLLPFSAAMKQFEDPKPAPTFDFAAILKKANAEMDARKAETTSNQSPQTARSGIPAIDTSNLGPPPTTFDFFKKPTQPTTPNPAQPSSVLFQLPTPATTPGSGASAETATATASNTITPASTPDRPRTPPSTTFQAGLSQGQGLSTFSTPPAQLLFQPAIQNEQPATPASPSNPHAIPGLFHQTPTAPLPTLISSVDAQKKARERLLDQLTHELMNEGDHSYMDQFFEHLLGGIVKDSVETVQKEEDDELVEKHRTWYLSRKFGRKWRKITWDRYLFREHAARKKRLAEAREAAIREAEQYGKELEKQEKAAARNVSPYWVMLGTQKKKSDPERTSTLKSPHPLVPSSYQPEPGSSKRERRNLGATSHNPTTSTSSHLTTSGKKRKSVGKETNGRDEPDRSEEAHISKRLRAMSNSNVNSINSNASPKRYSATESWKKHTETEKMKSESRRLSSSVGIDTTKTVYFKMIAMGMDPNTPVVPLTRRDIAEAQRAAALAVAQEPNENADGNTHSIDQSRTSNPVNDQQNDNHALQSMDRNAMMTMNHQQSIEGSMGPPQTPMKHPLLINDLSRASYSPEEQSLFDQAAKIKADLDDGSEWYRQELEKARRSTSSRSSPHPNLSTTSSLRQSYLNHSSPSKLRKGIIISPAHSIHNNDNNNITTSAAQTNPLVSSSSDPKSPSYWRSRISKIYKPDAQAEEAKRQKYGVLPHETAAQRKLREFDPNTPSRTQIRQEKNGGKDAWLTNSMYGQRKAAQTNKKGKGKAKAQEWGDMDYVDEEMDDGEEEEEEEDEALEEDALMTDGLEEEEEEGEGGEDEGDYYEDGSEYGNGISFTNLGHNGFAGSSSQYLGFGGGTGASADDAIEL